MAPDTRERVRELYKRYFPRIYTYIRSRVPTAADAEDVTAETFEQAYRSISTFDVSRGSESVWLYGIARNRVAALYRRSAPTASLSTDNLVDQGPSPEEQYLLSERQQTVLAAIRKLAPREREIIALRFLSQLTNGEVARITRLPRGYVAVIIHRGLKKLAPILSSVEAEHA